MQLNGDFYIYSFSHFPSPKGLKNLRFCCAMVALPLYVQVNAGFQRMIPKFHLPHPTQNMPLIHFILKRSAVYESISHLDCDEF